MPNESGIGALRVNFVRETTPGVTQVDPAWLRFSDEMDQAGQWAPNTNIAIRTAAGSPDVTGFSIGAEDHELQVIYKLQRWLTQATQVPLDALADGLLRDADGYIINTHSYLARQTLPAPAGTQSAGVRVYTYGTGGIFGSASLTGDPSTSEPVMADGTYRFVKVRSLRINQPTASGTVTVVSSNAGDTTQTVTVENEGAASSEGIALNGTTPVVGATSFADIDAINLDLETLGDITITFTSGAETVAVILGSVGQQDIEGDLGLPLLGSGSFEAALGTAFEHILGDTIQKGGTPIEANVMTMAINVSNNVQPDPVVTQKGKVLSEGNREVTAVATVFSETGSHDAIVQHLQATAGDITWLMTGGTVTLPGSVLTAPGARSYEKGNATMRRDNTFTSEGMTISP